MRISALIICSAAAFLLTDVTAVRATTTGSPDATSSVVGVTAVPMSLAAPELQQSQPPQIKVEVSSTQTKTVWYLQPIWLAIGGLALLVVILIIVMAARGSRNTTTVVK